MPSIKMKIVNYDPSTSSLIVTFASEKAQKSIDDYNAYAYQPTMFDTQDPEKVIEHIARAGIHIVKQQDKEEEFKNNTVLNSVYKSLVGKEFEYDISDLIAGAEQVVENMQEVSMLDEILTEINLDEDDS
jgi:hypothetical protein